MRSARLAQIFRPNEVENRTQSCALWRIFRRSAGKKDALGSTDKIKSVELVQIFCPVKETNRTHSRGYVEDLSTQTGRKRCTKTAVLSLSVLP